MSKIIACGDREAYERWQQPEVGSGSARPAAPMVTAGQLEKIQQQAYEEGLALGKREGLAQGRALAQEQVQRLEGICNTLGRPLQEMDEQVVNELTELAIAVARQIIRRELKTDPGHVMAAVQKSLAELPVASHNIRLYLNPEDVALVRESLAAGKDGNWQLLEDPGIGRGGCRVVTDASRIDATIEKRLAAIATELLGGERNDDHSE
ncbi:MAG: flagellar assembly protein FliH [Gammaproteobacteria bacterium]